MAKKKSTASQEDSIILPFIVLDGFVIYPEVFQPIKIEDEEQKKIINDCFENNSIIFIGSSQPAQNPPKTGKLNEIGVTCVIDKVLQMPGAPSLVFLHPEDRARFLGNVYSPKIPMARITSLPKIKTPKKISEEISLEIKRIDNLFKSLFEFIPELERKTSENLVNENSGSLVTKTYAMAQVAPISWEEKYKLLECDSFSSLLENFTSMLDLASQKIALQAKIHERTHQELSQQQKEAFLRTHLKQIKEELGETEETDDFEDLKAKAEEKKWSEETKQHFFKELKKLQRLNINNPEYSVQYAYLQAFLDLPWNNYARNRLSLEKVEQILNRDHYGLDKVKERILEYMAVVKLRNDLKAPILCLYGPPGVGKTSIGKSVAEATGREYARISLGGMHDEAEIRGHRRTYIGAMPGRFLHALSKTKYGNPLILLDEIDKVGKDFKGDPSSALLEALDPEQNNTFHDNFIDFPYDLSKVLFIATANDISSIPAPLRDRMEIIEMSGYTPEEKREIATRHLVNKVIHENGLDKENVKFDVETIDFIIKNYTKEKGVRQLEKALGRVARKLALMKVRTNEIPEEITPAHVSEMLGKKENYLKGVGFL